MYLLSLTTSSPVCPLSLKRAFKVAATEYPECKSESSLATPRKKTSLLEHYCTYESNLCMWTECQDLMHCTFLWHANTNALYPSTHTHAQMHGDTARTHTHTNSNACLFKQFFHLLQNRHAKVATTVGHNLQNNSSQ